LEAETNFINFVFHHGKIIENASCTGDEEAPLTAESKTVQHALPKAKAVNANPPP